MRTAKRLCRQGLKCVGSPPGRGAGCLPPAQGRLIMGRSARGRTRPWLGPATCSASHGTTSKPARAIAPTRGTGCAGRRQSCRPAHPASLSSVARLNAHGACSCSTDARSSPPTTRATLPAAGPSHTSAEARYTPAGASRCAGMPGTGIAALAPD